MTLHLKLHNSTRLFRQLLAVTEEVSQPFETYTYSYREKYKLRTRVGNPYCENLS